MPPNSTTTHRSHQGAKKHPGHSKPTKGNPKNIIRAWTEFGRFCTGGSVGRGLNQVPVEVKVVVEPASQLRGVARGDARAWWGGKNE